MPDGIYHHSSEKGRDVSRLFFISINCSSPKASCAWRHKKTLFLEIKTSEGVRKVIWIL